MPYQIVKQKDKKFKVCKADDSKVCFSKKGIPLKTAKRQVRAIVSGESKKGRGRRLGVKNERWWDDRYEEFLDYVRSLGVEEDEIYTQGIFKVKFETAYNNTARQSGRRVDSYSIATAVAQQNYDDFEGDSNEEEEKEEEKEEDDDEEEKVGVLSDEEIKKNKQLGEELEKEQEAIAEKFRIYLLDMPTQSKGFTAKTYPIAPAAVYTHDKVGEHDDYLNITEMNELYNHLKNELDNTPPIDKKRKAFIVNTAKIKNLKDFPLIFTINKVKQKLSGYNNHGNIGSNICVDKCSSDPTNWSMLGRSIKTYILGCFLDEQNRICFTTMAECGYTDDYLKIDHLCSANYGFTVFKAFRELQNNKDYEFWPNNPFNNESYLKLWSVSSYETVVFYWTQGLFSSDSDVEYSLKRFRNIIRDKVNVDAKRSDDSNYKDKLTAINAIRQQIKKGECNSFLNALYRACACGGNKFLFPKMLKEVGNSYKPISDTPDETNHTNLNEAFLKILDEEEKKIKDTRSYIGKVLLPQVPEAVKDIALKRTIEKAEAIKQARKKIARQKIKDIVKNEANRIIDQKRAVKSAVRGSLRGKDINIPLPSSNVESIVPQGESGLSMNFQIPEKSARNQRRIREKLEEARKRHEARMKAENEHRENFEDVERMLRSRRPNTRVGYFKRLTGINEPRERYLATEDLRQSGLSNIQTGSGVKGTKFYEELRSYGINPEDYLKQMKKWAKASGYDDKQLDFANNDVHKLRIMTEQGTKRFGRVGYKDYYIYRHLEKKKEVEKGYSKIMRDRFRKSHGAISKKGNLGRNSANELSIRILWHENDDKSK